MIKNELLKDLQIKEYESVTFYPEYMYSNFIGIFKITNDKESSIKPETGQFTQTLIKNYSK